VPAVEGEPQVEFVVGGPNHTPPAGGTIRHFGFTPAP
jgi:hypothetical protein